MKNRRIIKWVVNLILIGVVLIIGVKGSKWLKQNGPEAEGVTVAEPVVSVTYQTVEESDYTVTLETQGQVLPKRDTVVAAEVAGKIVSVSERLEVGGVLEEGEVLLRLDDADYRSILSSTIARVAEAELVLQQEEARAQQALRDWSKLGRSGQPSDLVLRKPQLISAQANLQAAKDGVIQAERNLARTEVKVPYRARVQRVMSNLGAYVLSGSAIAEIVSEGDLEVRLPMTLEDFGHLRSENAEIELTAKIGAEERTWRAVMVRGEGQVNRQTLTTIVIAKVLKNEIEGEEGEMMGILDYELPPAGLFVTASWKGRVLEDVYVIPRLALQPGNEVFLVSEENTLVRRSVGVVRTEEDRVIVRSGLSVGDKLIISPLGAPIVGMKLDPQGDEEQVVEVESQL